MFRSAALLLGSNVSLAILKMLRNVLIARLFSVEQFGIISTFAVVFALFDMLGYLGLDRLLVQARDGEAPRVQATLHTIQVARGFLLGGLLWLVADPLAAVMGVPDIAWAYRLMAIVPILQGFLHLDHARLQRDMDFGALIRIDLIAEVATILSIYPLYLLIGDWRAALAAFILQFFLRLGLSHLVARRPYGLGFDRDVAVRAIHFGWPLLLNTMLLFAIFQGDRVIVANRLGMTELGLFSLGFMLTLMAANILAQTQQRLFLPKLAPLQDDPAAFAALARIPLQSGLVIGLAVATGFSILGPDLVLVVFGAKFAGTLPILTWLALMQAVRIAKSGVAVVALARGETRISLLANIPRVALLPAAWIAVGQGGGALAVVWIAILGEIAGLVVAQLLVRRRIGVPLGGMVVPLTLWAAALALVAVDAWMFPPPPEPFAGFHGLQAGLVLAATAAVFGMGDLRRWLLARLAGRGRG